MPQTEKRSPSVAGRSKRTTPVGVVRPLVRAAARAAHTDARRDDDRESVREQLEVHALRRGARDGARRVHRRARLIPRACADRRRYRHLLDAIALVGLLAGCGGGGGSAAPTITVGAARTYALSGFTPAKPVHAGTPTRVSFTILQPDGKPLTQYKHGAGPHNGVHLIIVRRDLATIIHQHPPVGPNGLISDTITFPKPGPYRVVIDAYPKTSGPVPNFQRVREHPRRRRVPPAAAAAARDDADGRRLHDSRCTARRTCARSSPRSSTSRSRRRTGRRPSSSTWFGALAHAIFFRRGTLDYFHTHVCAPGVSGCTSIFGAARVTGHVGDAGPAEGRRARSRLRHVAPVPAVPRDGHVVTAPFTLQVR